MPESHEVKIIEVSPDRPARMALGGIVTLIASGAIATSAITDGSIFGAVVTVIGLLLSAFSLSVYSMHLRGPFEVRITPHGEVTYPVWFGTRTATVHLDTIAGLTFQRRSVLLLKGKPGTPSVGWTKAQYGQPAIDALYAALKGRFDPPGDGSPSP